MDVPSCCLYMGENHSLESTSLLRSSVLYNMLYTILWSEASMGLGVRVRRVGTHYLRLVDWSPFCGVLVCTCKGGRCGGNLGPCVGNEVHLGAILAW